MYFAPREMLVYRARGRERSVGWIVNTEGERERGLKRRRRLYELPGRENTVILI